MYWTPATIYLGTTIKQSWEAVQTEDIDLIKGCELFGIERLIPDAKCQPTEQCGGTNRTPVPKPPGLSLPASLGPLPHTNWPLQGWPVWEVPRSLSHSEDNSMTHPLGTWMDMGPH